MPKLIHVIHQELEAILDPKPQAEPGAGWLSLQRLKPTPGVPWFKAYPLTGGSMLVQENNFHIVRDATPEDARKDVWSNPYRNAAVQALFEKQES